MASGGNATTSHRRHDTSVGRLYLPVACGAARGVAENGDLPMIRRLRFPGDLAIGFVATDRLRAIALLLLMSQAALHAQLPNLSTTPEPATRPISIGGYAGFAMSNLASD